MFKKITVHAKDPSISSVETVSRKRRIFFQEDSKSVGKLLDSRTPSRRSLNVLHIDTVSITGVESEKAELRHFFHRFKKKPLVFTPEVLESEIHKLHKFCLTHLIDSYRLHLNREKGITLIENILVRSNYEDLRMSQAVSLVWCTISCVHHFYMRLHSGYKVERSKK